MTRTGQNGHTLTEKRRKTDVSHQLNTKYEDAGFKFSVAGELDVFFV